MHIFDQNAVKILWNVITFILFFYIWLYFKKLFIPVLKSWIFSNKHTVIIQLKVFFSLHFISANLHIHQASHFCLASEVHPHQMMFSRGKMGMLNWCASVSLKSLLLKRIGTFSETLRLNTFHLQDKRKNSITGFRNWE